MPNSCFFALGIVMWLLRVQPRSTEIYLHLQGLLNKIGIKGAPNLLELEHFRLLSEQWGERWRGTCHGCMMSHFGLLSCTEVCLREFVLMCYDDLDVFYLDCCTLSAQHIYPNIIFLHYVFNSMFGCFRYALEIWPLLLFYFLHCSFVPFVRLVVLSFIFCFFSPGV